MGGSGHFAVRRIVTGGLAILACLAGLLGAASAQELSAAQAADAIFARKTLMDTISDHMDAVEVMIATKKLDLARAQEHADIISVMLMAFPHLFPASTNQWKPDADLDPATDTFAAPELWRQFADFYQRAAAASKAAYGASRADKEEALETAVTQLRTQCDGCHAAYLKTQ